ncbi:hypothetical protein WR25_04264 [Diploscapter pachys]|uniref:Ig-like domain-containing protein n=1 Tax=Diploscapter pachys TaxID=2018661 RepID=A0A2A2K1U5_9BILA|nr:hypothetical protein WR25_04264 [Diploscapter pachys]
MAKRKKSENQLKYEATTYYSNPKIKISTYLNLGTILILLFLPSASTLGWASWSAWSPCSKPCGPGVSHQLRRCLSIRCSGHSVRYKICNLKECSKNSRAARDTTCGGEEIISQQQCEVVCRSRNSGARFLWRKEDGTPCENANNRAVCSRGTCQNVGCDDVVGSSLRFDACGSCGGRGDSCESAQFMWKVSDEFTPCVSSCEEAVQEYREGNKDREMARSVIVCVNAATGRVVPERLCADRKRPKGQTRPCPPLLCPSSWLASDWSDCLPQCGIGIRKRTVYCVQQTNNQTINVPDKFCVNYTKPPSEESCTSNVCGHWEASRWSRCSTSCGQGVKRRSVECIGGTDCEEKNRPVTEAHCYSGTPCPIVRKEVLPLLDTNSVEWGERQYLDGSSYSNPTDNQFKNSPRLVAGEWSECSSTCGPGVAGRKLECVAMHPVTATLHKLPLFECQSQPQPSLFKACEVRACPLHEEAKASGSNDDSPHQWQHGEWTQCSASCLGGKQKASLKCVEVSSGNAVPWSNCNARTRPPEKTRPCNQQACPPVWQTGAYLPCTATCGSGVSIRRVQCVRPVSRNGGADANIILPDSQCSQPKPESKQPCAIQQCPATWVTGEWTECSTSCGSGEQRRSVVCEGRDAKGRAERRNEKECISEKPNQVQMCSLGSCDKPELITNRVFEQNAELKKITLSIGGEATLRQGTSIKIKCPAKKFNKKKIYWTKNGQRIKNDAHIKVSSNGNLRLFHARMEDAGFYECFTDKLQGNMTLRFKYRDESRHGPTALDRDNRVRTEYDRITSEDKPVKQKYTNSTAFMENLLKAKNDDEVAKELEKYREVVRTEWDVGEWSECKQHTCRVSGYEARRVQCSIRVEGRKKVVEEAICEKVAGQRPAETRPCHRVDCPRWEAEEWTECALSKCIKNGVSLQRRNATCRMADGAILDEEKCDITNRPETKKECQNPSCKSEWTTSEWGACSSNCGTGGVQLRLLSCVWSSTGKPAGRSCESQRRPSSARACISDTVLPPCHATALPLMQDASCEDLSRFCDIIKLFHSCDSQEVRQRCCATCRHVEWKTPKDD